MPGEEKQLKKKKRRTPVSNSGPLHWKVRNVPPYKHVNKEKERLLETSILLLF